MQPGIWRHFPHPVGRALSHARGFGLRLDVAAFFMDGSFMAGFFTFAGARHAHSRRKLWQHMYHDLRGCNRSMCVSSYVLVEKQNWSSLLLQLRLPLHSLLLQAASSKLLPFRER